MKTVGQIKWEVSSQKCLWCTDRACSWFNAKLSILMSGWQTEDINKDDITTYLDSKLELYSNLKSFFDKIPSLIAILHTHMDLNALCKDKKNLKKIVKAELLRVGIYDDQKMLEFLMVISEWYRDFEDIPLDLSDIELWEYFFEKYSSNEIWSEADFVFFFKNTSSHQSDWIRRIEEVAIEMIASTRSDLEKTTQIPHVISEYIKEIEGYFEESFYKVFWKISPLKLADVTMLISGISWDFANRLCNRTFVDENWYESDRAKFAHVVIHEAMHLCFPWFHNTMLEEAFIELSLEKMYALNPNNSFPYSPVSKTYWDWVRNLKSIFFVLPWLEWILERYFFSHDISELQSYLRANLTTENINEIKTNHYSRGLDAFINKLVDIIKN